MDNITIRSTYSKVLMLIILSCVFFTALYFSLYYYIVTQEKEVNKNTISQYDNEIKKILLLNSDSHGLLINDITTWDEFVVFFTTKDKKWFDEVLSSALDTYRSDYEGAYDNEGNFITKFSNSKIKSFDFIPRNVIYELKRSKHLNFFLETPDGIIEVFGATVNPSNDSSKYNSKPAGCFFLVRLVDANYLKKLEKISESKIKFTAQELKSSITNNQVQITKPLKDWQGNNIANLTFTRNCDIHFSDIKKMLFLIFLGFLIYLFVNLYYSRRWIYQPLNLIISVLETGNRKSIKKLERLEDEFGHIGNLFKVNNNQRKQLEKSKLKAEESDQLKSSFLANLSHEIRTPMNAIVGFTDLLSNTNLTELEKSEYLKVIAKSGKNLVSIIEDLIEMSKIDANQISPNFSDVNLESCMNELYNTIKITIHKSKKFDFHIIENSKTVIKNIVTDEIKLKQIIINLVTNAIKFTDEGFVAFGYEIDKKNELIKFVIKDSGLGIDEKNHKFIFDRFRSVDNDLSIKLGGLGLGLAISKAYVEMLGGTITLESNVGIGSIFSFTIPLKISKETKFTEEPLIKKIAAKKDNETTILVAEDDNINFLLIEKIMQLKNYKIIRAKNGQEAVDLSLNNPEIDLVLMDIKMPILNGFQALEIIKKTKPDLPIIAQTAYASSDDQEKIKLAGFIGYITKPIVKEKLFDLINQVL